MVFVKVLRGSGVEWEGFRWMGREDDGVDVGEVLWADHVCFRLQVCE